MTKKVVGDQIQEDVVKTYTRQDAGRELSKCEADLPRWETQLKNTQEAIAQCKSDITEWKSVIAALPALPEVTLATPGEPPV